MPHEAHRYKLKAAVWRPVFCMMKTILQTEFRAILKTIDWGIGINHDTVFLFGCLIGSCLGHKTEKGKFL